MKTAILLFPGTNREQDIIKAVTVAGGKRPSVVWHRDTALPEGTDLVVVAGGYSYGDYLRPGAMAARSPVLNAVRTFAADGGCVLGVCNGFQILTEAGILPGALVRNRGLQFICRDVNLVVGTEKSPFTGGYRKGQKIRLPVAHQDGNYTADAETLKRLEDEDRIAFRYADANGVVSDETCLNGSLRSIAGVLSENRRVLGLMPHPENSIEAGFGGTDGLPLFKSLLETLS
ncbi:phosphoribosylformylglycinamidine synthase subunit PurQ [Phaeovibrio sulfidiphilus]|uniref:Phosphoribosylformylglycinamidine synthase subunit PurQ n=1 Tax=Phaeovibrio sulfidiphilus TaxID=1220600 RepID=A0A8J6YLM4_9PROT|nr:phosphoribosylformylglycinamidine synthase subunit PurQ [Phaeovibrio sulfidiphilus]